ncbi:hypothetical protein MUK42_09430 [Musa troglodytarum]|uniref:Uncharacterized protein n=1 Tax=Musa troglodytarum TaxID=320322 RepID=A0A9E7EQH5_9LILI|nr:hypothetical protein MUK42_09430 [Musa troglodytarum]
MPLRWRPTGVCRIRFMGVLGSSQCCRGRLVSRNVSWLRHKLRSPCMPPKHSPNPIKQLQPNARRTGTRFQVNRPSLVSTSETTSHRRSCEGIFKGYHKMMQNQNTCFLFCSSDNCSKMLLTLEA